MSRSNPTAVNPAARFMQWKGGAEAVKENGKTNYEGGKLTFFDKTLGEHGENVDVELPFSFIVLDELSTITGFSEKDKSGFWSNEVRSLANQQFIVKTKGGTVATGLYAKISDTIKSKGAKYAQSVYVAFKDESGELQIGNIKFAGASLTAWIEFKKKFDIMKCAVVMTDNPKLDKKGTNYYFTPTFEGKNVSDATDTASKALDVELQTYLNTYFSRKPEADDNISVDDFEEDDVEPTSTDGQVNETTETDSAPIEDIEEKPINLSEIPF